MPRSAALQACYSTNDVVSWVVPSRLDLASQIINDNRTNVITSPSGEYLTEIKRIALELERQLSILQTAMAFARDVSLAREFDSVRKAIRNVKLDGLLSLEKQAAKMRRQLEPGRQAAGGGSMKEQEQLRSIIMSCLRDAGVAGAGNQVSGIPTSSHEEAIYAC